MKVLKMFDATYVAALADLHRRITAPVQLVCGDRDPFLPITRVRSIVPPSLTPA